jgi:hypothetical protein
MHTTTWWCTLLTLNFVGQIPEYISRRSAEHEVLIRQREWPWHSIGRSLPIINFLLADSAGWLLILILAFNNNFHLYTWRPQGYLSFLQEQLRRCNHLAFSAGWLLIFIWNL